MKVLVIGGGPVGLVTACGYASLGHSVFVCEANSSRLDSLKKGLVDFYEPSLQQEFGKYFKSKQIKIVHSLATGIQACPEVIFVCVGTPSLAKTGETDLKFLWSFLDEFLELLKTTQKILAKNNILIIIKSTVPVGTSEKVAIKISDQPMAKNLSVGFSPEFLRQGSALEDFFKPDRTVLGVTSLYKNSSTKIFKELIGEHACKNLIITTSQSAELSKYAANAFLPLKISFANEVANFAQATGASSRDVLKIVGLDKRIGPDFLKPGPGFGGSCFPKDLASLVFQGRVKKVPMTLAKATLEVNENQHKMFVGKIIELCGSEAKKMTVGILALAFKPNTSDLRSSPGLAIAKLLAKKVKKVLAYDPLVQSLQEKNIELCKTSKEFFLKAQLIVLTTDDLAMARLIEKRKLKGLKIVDCRNVLPEGPDTIKFV